MCSDTVRIGDPGKVSESAAGMLHLFGDSIDCHYGRDCLPYQRELAVLRIFRINGPSGSTVSTTECLCNQPFCGVGLVSKGCISDDSLRSSRIRTWLLPVLPGR